MHDAASAPATTDGIAEIVRHHWGIEARAELLPGYAGRNYRLTATDGSRYVLKIAGADAERDAIDLQIAILEHLAAAELSFATPAPIATTEGAAVIETPHARGGTVPAYLVTYLGGVLWHQLDERPLALYRALGAALGELDRALLDLEHPAAARQIEWDLLAAERQRPHVSLIDDAARRRRAEDAFHRFAALEPLGLNDLRRSLVHNDANDHNLLVAPQVPTVAGLLDFGDAVESVTLAELAIALAYALLQSPDPLADAGAAVAGYDSVLPLDERELSMLWPLIATRLAVSVVKAARNRRRDPDNEYLFVSEEPAWRLLERLSATSSAAAADHFLEAVGKRSRAETEAPRPAALLAARQTSIGPSLSVAYREPLEIVAGRGQYLFDRHGQPYLDLVNNVCHVGHCHPRVVAAGSEQMARLNTNTRYLYRQLTDYAERLTAKLPSELSVCYFVCSGSEANELALRLARTHTGRRDLVVVEGAYHGHTTTLIEVSPYKFMRAGGTGRPEPYVHVAPSPDPYRGKHKGSGPETAARYAAEVERVIASAGQPVAALLCEPLLGCGGQIVPPTGFLRQAFEAVRRAGGVAIADEVQIGFGRVGSSFWAFELDGARPDIVTLGKPIGNGHPMAAVATTPEIARSFANGMEYFNTFGGNPVSCAIGMAVLDVIEEENLQRRAAEVGADLLARLGTLAERHPLIGEVRGRGLYIGVELVRDRRTLEPATSEAGEIKERLKERRILISTDGPLDNVLKIKPPLVIDHDDVAWLARELDAALASVAVRA